MKVAEMILLLRLIDNRYEELKSRYRYLHAMHAGETERRQREWNRKVMRILTGDVGEYG